MVLTKSELQIMDVFWNSDKPLSRSDLLDYSEGKTWKDSSVHILLNGLLAKGAIKEEGLVKRSKTYGRTFVPSVTREGYFATTIFCHKCKPDFVGLMCSLLERKDISADEIMQIEALVAAKKKQLIE